MQNGYQPPQGPQQPGLSAYASDFPDDEHLRVAIWSPQAREDERARGFKAGSARNPEKLLYPHKTQQMAQAVADAIGVDVGKVEQKGYYALDKDDTDDSELLDQTAAGNFIFDYDPVAYGKKSPGWRILWQRDFLYGDQW
ncbi:MAG: hypothetical protein Q9183_003232 [Haloplaca sp. 2 TL-2023]